MARRARSHQAGFTLIEIMFVVAIVAILAALAIPQFLSESRKTKANSEVAAFFAELATRQEQYKVDNGVYLTTAQCPAATSVTGQVVDCATSGKAWNMTPTTNLNVKVPMEKAFCTYTMTAGTTAAGNVTVGATTFTFTASANTAWYQILARCDLDGDGTQSLFFTSSNNSTIQKSTVEDE